MKLTTINEQTYTANFPKCDWCKVKVAVKPRNWEPSTAFRAGVITDAIYDSGFVSIDGGKTWILGSNFLFHKLKCIKFKHIIDKQNRIVDQY